MNKMELFLLPLITLLIITISYIIPFYQKRKIKKQFEPFKHNHILLLNDNAFSTFRTVRAVINYGNQQTQNIQLHHLSQFPVPFGATIRFVNSKDKDLTEPYYVETNPSYQILEVQGKFAIPRGLIYILLALLLLSGPAPLNILQEYLPENVIKLLRDFVVNGFIFLALIIVVLELIVKVFINPNVKFVQKQL